MSLIVPNLDDRDFEFLVEQAKEIIRERCPGWTDVSHNDPGIILVEVFAHLTEALIYRLNRLPEKAYIEFLRLLGVKLHPPSAAKVELVFTRTTPGDKPIRIPRGSQVTARIPSSSGANPVFVITDDVVLEPYKLSGSTDKPSKTATAFHCEWITDEILGIGTGRAHQTFMVKRAPIILPELAEALDLRVGVELVDGEEDMYEGASISAFGKRYALWSRIADFSDQTEEASVYTVDLWQGAIQFSPGLYRVGADGRLTDHRIPLKNVPQKGREIRIWYCTGGGEDGNAPAGSLTVLKTKDRLDGVTVTNPYPAQGGRKAESLEHAMIRGPLEMRSLERTVTAKDYELKAMSASGAISRAKAITKRSMWKYAEPGTVEVVVAPAAPYSTVQSSKAIQQFLDKAIQDSLPLKVIADDLDKRKPIGSSCEVRWARFKTVSVAAKVIVQNFQDREAIKERLVYRLNNLLTPIAKPYADTPVWQFGESLRQSHIDRVLLTEPGVNYVENLALMIDKAPQTNVESLAPDPVHTGVWYCVTRASETPGSNDAVFRTENDARGWELILELPPEGDTQNHPFLIKPAQKHPGWIAMITHRQNPPGNKGSCVYISEDCGDTWRMRRGVDFMLYDLAWIETKDTFSVLLAGDEGLFEYDLTSSAGERQISSTQGISAKGFRAVAVASIGNSPLHIMIASLSEATVYWSQNAGATFQSFPIAAGINVKTLIAQQIGNRCYFWAGSESNNACYRWEILERDDRPNTAKKWERFTDGWQGGTCHALACANEIIVAGTEKGGVLWLNPFSAQAAWTVPTIESGLPLKDTTSSISFDRIFALAARSDKEIQILAGGPQGVYRSALEKTKEKPLALSKFSDCGSAQLEEEVTLPSSWLFCPGEHRIEVVYEYER